MANLLSNQLKLSLSILQLILSFKLSSFTIISNEQEELHSHPLQQNETYHRNLQSIQNDHLSNRILDQDIVYMTRGQNGTIGDPIDHYKHRCIHDSRFKNLKPQVVHIDVHEFSDATKNYTQFNSENNRNRLLATAANFHKMRISIDYRRSDQYIALNYRLKPIYDMTIEILENVKKYFSTFVDVRFPNRIGLKSLTLQDGYTIDAFSMEADLKIIIVPEFNTYSSHFAAASGIVLSPIDNRPIVGLYYLNFAALKASKTNSWQYFNIFAHEFTHVLGFSDNLYVNFYKDGIMRPINETIKQVQIGNQQYTAIVLPEVLNFAREHFGCQALEGVPLENGGGDGSSNSHWEKLFLSNSYMNSVTEFPGFISDFTLKLLNSTGWYFIDSKAPQHLEWGLNRGCAFFSDCPKSPEFCNIEDVGTDLCSDTYLDTGSCQKSEAFTPGCSFRVASSNSSCFIFNPGETIKHKSEYYGPHSRCFEWKNYQGTGKRDIARCHAAFCKEGRLKIKFGDGREKDCMTTGEEISLEDGYVLRCPNIKSFCEKFERRCPMDCNGNGICLVNSRCFCFGKLSGASCDNGRANVTDSFVLQANKSVYYEVEGYKHLHIDFLHTFIWFIAILLNN